jgi:hypothetical protein
MHFTYLSEATVREDLWALSGCLMGLRLKEKNLKNPTIAENCKMAYSVNHQSLYPFAEDLGF